MVFIEEGRDRRALFEPRVPRAKLVTKNQQLFEESGFPFLCFDRGFNLPGVGERHTFDVEATLRVNSGPARVRVWR